MGKKEVYEGLDPEEVEEEDELELLEKLEKPKRLLPKQEKVVRKRYVVFSQASRLGIADGETGEVIAEGEVDRIVLEALTNILERLERIETTMGSFVGR